jgi:hypothetical protein
MAGLALAVCWLHACPVPSSIAATNNPHRAALPNRYEPPPANFPRFSFAGHEAEADLLSRYLWYHFSTRLHLQKALFYQEYLSAADMWMGGAFFTRSGKPIQEVFRNNLLAIEIDNEGYVHTHQHFSHAHDHGWPFPLWPQAGFSLEAVKGVTCGWHFQKSGPEKRQWVWHWLKAWGAPGYHGESATRGWDLANCKSLGIVDGRWGIQSTGPSPAITTPEGMEIDAFNAPFLQLRWKRTGEPRHHVLPYLEWIREGDADFGPDRRVYLHVDNTLNAFTKVVHTMVAMHRHPKWKGRIRRMRLSLAPGETHVRFDIDSFFTVYDTRHPINNPIFIRASWNYYRWTGDLAFLHANINRMRLALRYQMTEMGGRQHNTILNRWPGHDGLPGWVRDGQGRPRIRPGHGIGNNYYDLIPFGWKDCYSTMQYYASLLVMAELEEAVRANPGWGIPGGALAFDPELLRRHAAAVKETGNHLFWNDDTGRFFGCIDRQGNRHDYGFTWLGLEGIWYDFATADHARSIMDWIDGRRIVEGDTSTGDDIYRWRFGPRATTLRNLEWYGQVWNQPESIPWGGQIQDGGAVLGFAFYDLYARVQVFGADDAWQRLTKVLQWEAEVWQEGGYRAYYADGKRGTTLQGGGTAGGIGIDFEFFESSLLPSIVVYGLLGIEPSADTLGVQPRLPSQCPRMTVYNLLYRNALMDVTAGRDAVTVKLKMTPMDPIRIRLAGSWTLDTSHQAGNDFTLPKLGTYTFRRH